MFDVNKITSVDLDRVKELREVIFSTMEHKVNLNAYSKTINSDGSWLPILGARSRLLSREVLGVCGCIAGFSSALGERNGQSFRGIVDTGAEFLGLSIKEVGDSGIFSISQNKELTHKEEALARLDAIIEKFNVLS